MKNGDLVVGVPSSEETRQEDPTVLGTYEKVTFSIVGEEQTVEFVVVDGVYISCDEIRPATSRDKRVS